MKQVSGEHVRFADSRLALVLSLCIYLAVELSRIVAEHETSWSMVSNSTSGHFPSDFYSSESLSRMVT